MLRLCAVCKEKKTERLMDGGWGEMKPVCGECLRSGRWKELLPPKPSKPSAFKPSAGGVGDYLCPKCGITHKAGSKVHKRHLKFLKAEV